MSEVLLKQLVAICFIAYFMWCMRFSALRRNWVPAIFFVSYAAFSQNFSFFFRELHQVLLVGLILHGVLSFGKHSRVRAFDLSLLFFGLFILVSLAFNVFDEDAKGQFVNYVVSALVARQLLSEVSQKTEEFERALQFLASLCVGMACVGVLESLLGISPRSEATLSNPNYYAHFLGVGFCIQWSFRRDRFRLLKLFIIFVGIIVSGSRSAILIPAIQIVWSAYVGGGLVRLAKHTLPGVVVVVLLLASGSTRFTDKDDSQASDAERLIFASIAYRMSLDRPVTGVGWGRFISEFSSYSSGSEEVVINSGVVDVSEQDRRVTHNDFMRILAELGWLGFLASVIFTVHIFFMMMRFRFGIPQYVFPVWTGTLLFSLTHNNMNSAFFWFLFLLPQVWLSSREGVQRRAASIHRGAEL